jgi:hypothetical protein
LAEAGTEAVTDRISLADQIAYARKVLDRTGARAAVAIIDTLEWLRENEAKIKAKIAPSPPLCSTPSGRVYTQKARCFFDMSKGGWEQQWEIYDDTGAIVGMKYVGALTRHSKVETAFIPFGARSFDNAAEFIAAYERGEWKAQEPRPA